MEKADSVNTGLLYICDRRKCEECHDECKHTTDITHAVNFKNDKGVWVEKEKK